MPVYGMWHLRSLKHAATNPSSGCCCTCLASKKHFSTPGRTSHLPSAMAIRVRLLTSRHTGHHRAQANSRLRALGAEPPIIDYIAWLWLERPAPAWPEVVSS